MPSSLRLPIALGAVALAIGPSLFAQAAEPVGTLARITGTAVVSQGAQYAVGYEGMALQEGDRLFVLEGGSALVAFADGCQYRVQDNELLIVPAVSTCSATDAVATESHKVAPYSAIASVPPTGNAEGFRLAQLGGGGGTVPVTAVAAWIPPALAVTTFVTALAEDNDASRPISP